MPTPKNIPLTPGLLLTPDTPSGLHEGAALHPYVGGCCDRMGEEMRPIQPASPRARPLARIANDNGRTLEAIPSYWPL